MSVKQEGGRDSVLGKRKQSFEQPRRLAKATVTYQHMSDRDRGKFDAAVHLLRNNFSNTQLCNQLMQEIKCISEDVAREVEMHASEGLCALEFACKQSDVLLHDKRGDVGKRVFIAWVGDHATHVPDDKLTNGDMVWYRGIVLEHRADKKRSHKIGYEDGEVRWHNADDMIRRDQWSWIHVA